METAAPVPRLSATVPPRRAGLPQFVLRFGALYLALFNVGAVLGLIPGTGPLATAWNTAGKRTAAWLGHAVLGITREIPVGPTGSSDTTADWIRVGLCLFVAAVLGAIWQRLDPRPATDDVVRRWLRFGLRWVLGSAMLVYGFMKLVPPTQFPAPSFYQLTQTFGEFSPQGLLWKFLGFSPAYVAFLGVGEVTAGLLLFFRRTTLAGALVAAAIMTNVVTLNLCYDVPVKLYSSHLLLMAVCLLWHDRHRLVSLLWSNRGAEPAVDPLPAALTSRPRLTLALHLLLFAGALDHSAGGQWRTRTAEAARYGFTPAELRGIWRVETFVRDGETLPPLVTEPRRWHTIIFGDYRSVVTRRMDGERGGFWFVRKSATPAEYLFEPPGANSPPLPVTIKQPEPGRMELAGKLSGSELQVTLRRIDEQQFTLFSRGFHWITETSFNR